MSKITKLLKDELRNNINALDYFEAKHEIYDSYGDLNFAVFGGKPETVEEENLYERVAKEFLDELKEKREYEVSQKGIFVKNNHTIEIMTKADFYLEICGMDAVNSTPYERAVAKEKAKGEGRFFVYYPKWRSYMLEHFNAQELADALAVLFQDEDFKEFVLDMINDCEEFESFAND